MFIFLRTVTGFQNYGLPKGALERSLSTSLRRRQRLVSTSLSSKFYAFSLSFRISVVPKKTCQKMSSSLLIQISSLRRNNNDSTSVIYTPLPFLSRYSSNRILSRLGNSLYMILFTTRRQTQRYAYPTHQTRKPSYITPLRQKNPGSRESYASELHQVIILLLSKVGGTSC